ILAYFPPRIAAQGYYEQLENLVRFTGAPAIVCEGEYIGRASDGEGHGARLIAKPVLEQLDNNSGMTFHQPTGEDTAYIQFSSGTTGTPKGIILTHTALVHYLEISQESMDITPADTTVGWLPLFHDMGLCTQVIQPVYSHIHSIFFAPGDWLRNPHILFQAIHRFKGTISWMPNFAFKFCIRHVREEQMMGLDLSSWRLLGCGSEPVQMDALLDFADHFSTYGFDHNALTVSYGLAEHVAGVTTSPLKVVPRVDWISEAALQDLAAVPVEPESEGSRAITSCGRAKPSVELKIIDSRGETLEERQVGEVLVRSESLFMGYFKLPDETSAALKDGWLYTGDLGYLLDGELYICGRQKELIIVRGRNLLPHHVEEIAQKVLGKHMRYAVAFGIADPESGTELPVLVCEMRGDQDEHPLDTWRAVLREKANQALQVYLDDIRFVGKGWIVKTTSGKINHAANREKYLQEFAGSPVASSTSIKERTPGWSPTEKQMYRIWAELLNTDAIGLHDNFFKLGGDSLRAAQLLLEIEAYFGLNLPSSIYFEEPTIEKIAHRVDNDYGGLTTQIAVPIQPPSPKNQRPVFFCVHAIGGGVLAYRTLSRSMGNAQPFYGLQARGLNGKETPDTRVETMAARYIEAMREIQPAGPYHLGGFCFGGVVAYEMARQLAEAGEQVADLVVIDRYAPRRSSWQSIIVDELRRDYQFFRHLPAELRKILSMNAGQRWDRMSRVARRLSRRVFQLLGKKSDISLEDVLDTSDRSSLSKTIDAAIVEAYLHYRPKPYPGSLTLIRTPRGFLDPDKAMGWDKLAAGNVRVHIIPGVHDDILQSPNVEKLAETLKNILSSN
ncbi:MAG: non-ribosomal peptide synthetase, partial [Anaerolineae bacterium]|nr:non-ribosomal peptide synthetase [Anaerolineae bacterium]